MYTPIFFIGKTLNVVICTIALFVNINSQNDSIFHTVLQCTTAPDIPRAVIKSVSDEDHYLPGTTVEYQCVPNYQLTDISTVTCVVNDTSKTAEWSDTERVKCIPGECTNNNPHTHYRILQMYGLFLQRTVKSGSQYYINRLQLINDISSAFYG